uniref:Peptidase M4 n=1 Tax=uncultured bacterium contig00042 TaxID=1181529 RepID=A0A806KID8_9BACT|nr:peptidase M4 [uncultured bacterium contig00042]
MYKKTVLFLFTVFFFSGILSAQNAQELSFGYPVSSTLRVGSEIWYNIRPPQTGFAKIETTGSTDTYMEVYDERQNLLIDDDDGGEGVNASLVVYLSAGRTYLIKVKGAVIGAAGPFSISANYISSPQITELRFGLARAGELSPGGSLWYSVKTTEKCILVVETTGDNFDAYMDAYDGDYAWIRGDDDGGSRNNARIELDAEAGQTFYFKVRSYDSGSGPFGIIANTEAFVEDQKNTERSGAVALRMGEEFPVSIRMPRESRWYSFEITRANTNFVIQTRGNMDTLLYLYDSNGNLLAQDDDSAILYNALISATLNPGTYYIEIKYVHLTTGRCTILAGIR